MSSCVVSSAVVQPSTLEWQPKVGCIGNQYCFGSPLDNTPQACKGFISGTEFVSLWFLCGALLPHSLTAFRVQVHVCVCAYIHVYIVYNFRQIWDDFLRLYQAILVLFIPLPSVLIFLLPLWIYLLPFLSPVSCYFPFQAPSPALLLSVRWLLRVDVTGETDEREHTAWHSSFEILATLF